MAQQLTAAGLYGNGGLQAVPDGARISSGSVASVGPTGSQGERINVTVWEDPAFWLVVLVGVVIALAAWST